MTDNQFLYSDNIILYVFSIICLIIIIKLFRLNRIFGIVNALIFCLYNSVLYYNLFYKGQGGSGFIWWFYLIILTLVQIIILGIYLAIKYFNKKQ